MTDEEQIERVARALAADEYGDGNDEPWEPFSRQARVAIAALTETEASRMRSDVERGVEEAFEQVRTQLNHEHRKGITSYRELKSGVNNAAFVRDAALSSAPSASRGEEIARLRQALFAIQHYMGIDDRDTIGGMVTIARNALATPVAQPEKERGDG